MVRNQTLNIFGKNRLVTLPQPTLSRLSDVQFHKLLELSGKILQQNHEEQNGITIKEMQRPLDDIREELRKATASDPDVLLVHGKRYSRDNRLISQLKILRNFQCQICGTTISKRDGSKYIEAAHITAKRNRGCEMPSNVIILCPNHHKEFDFGDLDMLELTETHIRFRLNGIEHTIDLSV